MLCIWLCGLYESVNLNARGFTLIQNAESKPTPLIVCGYDVNQPYIS